MNGAKQIWQYLAVIGFGIGVATWSSLLHDLTDAFLSVIGVIDMSEYEKLLKMSLPSGVVVMVTIYDLLFWFLT